MFCYQSPNLLWRIQNGELPDTLKPNVIWLLIGTNDLGNAWCSPELVVIGIVRIVQELRVRKPAATIVINGLLPRTFHRKGSLMKGRSNFLSWTRVSLPSLWPDIIAINEELKHYAESHEKVHYFNTNVFFVDKDAPVEKLHIHSKLMPDHLHPSTEGYELWAKDIMQKLDELVQ
jgi:lysophospholipase L1-like esterase